VPITWSRCWPDYSYSSLRYYGEDGVADVHQDAD
jgi:hypothetical protein